MTTIPLHPRQTPRASLPNPLPHLLHTPTGYALLELQGSLNIPHTASTSSSRYPEIQIGHLSFPDYHPSLQLTDKSWMKRVYMYVGQHQRLSGEIKPLAKPVAVIRKRVKDDDGGVQGDDEMGVTEGEGEQGEALEIVEIVKWKILFSSRPEPVGRESVD